MSIVRYTVLRLGLIAAFAGAFYLLGMRSYLLAFAAILCGAMAGYIFFPRLGQEAAGSVEALVARRERPAKQSDAGPTDEDIEDGLADEQD